MSNIRAAVRRLSFAKKAKLRVADAKKGLVVFQPDPGRRFDYAELVKSYSRESYGVRQVDLTVTGEVEERVATLDASKKVLVLHVKETGNVFLLQVDGGVSTPQLPIGRRVRLTGTLEPGKEAPDRLRVQTENTDSR